MTQILSNHPSMCRYVGHDYPRPYFYPVQKPIEPNYKKEDLIALAPLEAHAELSCRRCGHWKIIDYQGNLVKQK